MDVSMAVAGLLMFGDEVKNEITSNILVTTGYPRSLSICIVVLVAVIPLTKVPLKSVSPVPFLCATAGLLTEAVLDPSSAPWRSSRASTPVSCPTAKL